MNPPREKSSEKTDVTPDGTVLCEGKKNPFRGYAVKRREKSIEEKKINKKIRPCQRQKYSETPPGGTRQLDSPEFLQVSRRQWANCEDFSDEYNQVRRPQPPPPQRENKKIKTHRPTGESGQTENNKEVIRCSKDLQKPAERFIYILFFLINI